MLPSLSGKIQGFFYLYSFLANSTRWKFLWIFVRIRSDHLNRIRRSIEMKVADNCMQFIFLGSFYLRFISFGNMVRIKPFAQFHISPLYKYVMSNLLFILCQFPRLTYYVIKCFFSHRLTYTFYSPKNYHFLLWHIFFLSINLGY